MGGFRAFVGYDQAQLTFELPAKGSATGVILHQGGTDQRAVALFGR